MGYIGQAPTDVPLTGSDLADSIINSAKIADGTIVQGDMDMTSNYAFSGTVSGAGAPSHRNDIINGGLVVNQENQTAPADDDYTIGDLFLHVGEGTPVMSLEADGPQGTRPWQKMVLDANAQGGLVYFLSNDDIQDYIANGKMSFGIQLKTTAATISNARIGILKWVGTADVMTSDVVGTWASDGTNPTLATSWSYENTPANIGLTTSWARHTVEDVTVDSDTKNIAIFIWTDDGTITASDVIGFSEWQMNPGATVNDFSQPDAGTVQGQVDYYLQRFEYTSTTSELVTSATAQLSAIINYFGIQFRNAMRSVPAITASGAGTFTVSGLGTPRVGTGIAFSLTGLQNLRIGLNIATGSFAAHNVNYILRDGTDTTWVMMDARY